MYHDQGKQGPSPPKGGLFSAVLLGEAREHGAGHPSGTDESTICASMSSCGR